MNALPHILVVDDDPDVCDVVRQLLEGSNLRVSIAANGREMRAVLADDAIDLVIIDALMPGESGISLAQHARALHVAVIIMTGDPDQRDLVEISGFPFIFKPFRMNELLDLVREALQSASC
jgi:two-component system OmpR family response regulator